MVRCLRAGSVACLGLLGLIACTNARNEPAPAPDPCAPIEADDQRSDAAQPALDFPRNVILLLGDGVGLAHWEAARAEAGGSLALDGLEGPVLYATDSLTLGAPTDSAASATAMATGRCTHNGAVGVDAAGVSLPNVLELGSRHGKRSGVVTNTIVVDASPMAFIAHSPSRYCGAQLAAQAFELEGLELLLGGFVPEGGLDGASLQRLASAAGWQLLQERAQLLESSPGPEPLLGLFGQGPSVAAWPEWEYGLTPEVLREGEGDEPTLAELTEFALGRLAPAPEGFLLMVENEHPDTVGHVAHLDVALASQWMPGLVLELDGALGRVLEWVERESSFEETLVVVCSDHETGGYMPGSDEGEMPVPPAFPAAPNHTVSAVPIYARGPGSERLDDITHVSDIFHLLTGSLDELSGTGSCR